MSLPNHYSLRGSNLSINYFTQNLAGQPSLEYNDGTNTRNFSGAQIHTQATDAGTLVTVVLDSVLSFGSTSFSFLLPNIVPEGLKTLHFKTIGITTHNKGVNPAPDTGVRQTYSFVDLNGSANVVFTEAAAAQPETAAAAH